MKRTHDEFTSSGGRAETSSAAAENSLDALVMTILAKTCALSNQLRTPDQKGDALPDVRKVETSPAPAPLRK